MIDLDTLRKLGDEATPGPWIAIVDDPSWLSPNRCGGISPAHNHAAAVECWAAEPPCPARIEIVTTDSGVYGPCRADALFIVAARSALPELCDEVERLTAALADKALVLERYAVLRDQNVALRKERDELRRLVRRVEADDGECDAVLIRDIGVAITQWDAEKEGDS